MEFVSASTILLDLTKLQASGAPQLNNIGHIV